MSILFRLLLSPSRKSDCYSVDDKNDDAGMVFKGK